MDKIKTYRGEGITVQFDPARCIHAAECVHGLPAVFDLKARPWIQPAKASAAEVAATVARCPSGALQATRDDGQAAEAPAPHNSATLVADGPLHLRGNIELHDAKHGTTKHETRLALCRCGASKNKPYCDNSHEGIGFKDDGVCAKGELKPLAQGPLKITLTVDGPAQCDGPLTLVDAFGETVAAVEQTWLCRCGGSQNKPYCDGSHKKIGFRS